MSLLDRVLEHPPAWAEDILQPWDEAAYQEKAPFISRHYWTSQGSINVFSVVGTIHSDYQNHSWLHLLQNGKRMHLNLPLLESNPHYYHDTCSKEPPMYFKTLDGRRFYIDDDGNHRTCIARFYFYEQGLTQLHGVVINHYQIDEEFFSIYQQLEQEIRRQGLKIWLKPTRKSIGRDDTAGWKEDLFETELKWQEGSQTLLLDKAAALEKLEALRRRKHSWLSKLFSKL
ncbi:hypothetical protein [Neisseria yangbaofengii]|uniref:hypothetical protein n=1 Tax=Neisseria yangbaofengii TaxID=2709396 RepID=UPI0013EC06A2|nr:hypothetical protein [Neisseria yangbaofengii]